MSPGNSGCTTGPWPERPIFSQVRSMAASSLRRKTGIDEYVRKMAAMAES
jgi:hypothetical protein